VIFDGFHRNREEVLSLLAEHDIIARRYFYPSVDSAECYQNAYPADKTPISHYIADRVLTLPLYADLTVEEVDVICNVLLS